MKIHILLAALLSGTLSGEILTSLDPADAIYDGGAVDDGEAGGSNSGIGTLAAAEHELGFTANIAFTPEADDLEDTVMLMELGGTSNGFGLMLVDGVPTLVLKFNSNDAALPDPVAELPDTEGNTIAVQSTFGTLSAGTTYSFSASFAPSGALEILFQPDGGSLTTDTFMVAGGTVNWSGNDTLTVGPFSVGGSAGGLSGNNPANEFGPPWDVDDAFSFLGTIASAQLWNDAEITDPFTLPPSVEAFEITSLDGSETNLRFHWRVTEGTVGDSVEIVINDGSADVHTTSELNGFFDLTGASSTSFTLTASNDTGSDDRSAQLAPDNAHASAVRSAAPVAWFRFNENAGSPLFIDSADNAAPHDAIASGEGVSSGTAGSLDGAATFDGTAGLNSDFILDPATTPGFTIETVMLVDSGLAGTLTLFGNQDGSGMGRNNLIINPSLTEFGYSLRSLIGGGPPQSKHADEPFPKDTWCHLVMVVDNGATPDIRYYLNGLPVGNSRDGVNADDGSTFDVDFATEASDGAWTIAMNRFSGGEFWLGAIDEFIVYDSLLDDPDADDDLGDSLVTSHRDAWYGETSGTLGAWANVADITAGSATDLFVKVAGDATSVSINNGVGTISPDADGVATASVSPAETTTYTVTIEGPGGPFTREVTVNVSAPPAPPVITSIHVNQETEQVELTFTGAPNTTYNLTASTDLSGFSELFQVVTDEEGAGQRTFDLLPDTDREFYRLEDLP